MSAENEATVIGLDQKKVDPVDEDFQERYKYVIWSPEEIAQMEELAENGNLKQYLENRRHQAMLAIGMAAPDSIGTKVTSRSFSVASRDASVSDASDFLANVSEIFNILKKTKIAEVFQGLGLVLGCVDFFMTLLNPGEPDPTQELIKQCFEKMMTQLSVLATQVDEVKRAVQWSAVQDALGESETNIRNALDKYNDFQTHIGTSYETQYLNDFLDYCTEINLENCMRTLTSAFTSRPTAFGVRKLPEWAVENTKHDYGVMQKLFTVVCRMLLPAMHMYLFTARSKNLNLTFEADQWATTIEQVKSSCEEQLNLVIDSLSSYIDDDFNTFFTSRGFGDYGNTWWSYMTISRDTHDFFKAKYPFANFAVFAYTPMGGSDQHSISYYDKTSRTFLHSGTNHINVYVLWEKAKETNDRYIRWLDAPGRSQLLQNDIQSLKNHLNSHKSGNADSILSSCPSETSGERWFTAYIVPNSSTSLCNGIHKSTLTKFSSFSNVSTANNSNWNFVIQRYFGYYSYYGNK